MNKDFIRDDNNVIKNCPKNVSKMNVFEHMYYQIFHWKLIQMMLVGLWEDIVEGSECLVGILLRLFELIFLPILLVAGAVVQIRNARKRVNIMKNRR